MAIHVAALVALPQFGTPARSGAIHKDSNSVQHNAVPATGVTGGTEAMDGHQRPERHPPSAMQPRGSLPQAPELQVELPAKLPDAHSIFEPGIPNGADPTTTITWIGYAEASPQLAPFGGTDQAAFKSEDVSPGRIDEEGDGKESTDLGTETLSSDVFSPAPEPPGSLFNLGSAAQDETAEMQGIDAGDEVSLPTKAAANVSSDDMPDDSASEGHAGVADSSGSTQIGTGQESTDAETFDDSPGDMASAVADAGPDPVTTEPHAAADQTRTESEPVGESSPSADDSTSGPSSGEAPAAEMSAPPQYEESQESLPTFRDNEQRDQELNSPSGLGDQNDAPAGSIDSEIGSGASSARELSTDSHGGATTPRAHRGALVDPLATLGDMDSVAASSIRVPPDQWKAGKPLAREGMIIRPYSLFRHIVRDSGDTLFSLTGTSGVSTNPIVAIQFDRTGKVGRVEILRRSGFAALDEKYLSSWMARWTAVDPRLAKLEADELTNPIVFRLLFIEEVERPSGDIVGAPEKK